jgi:hypothetical protein
MNRDHVQPHLHSGLGSLIQTSLRSPSIWVFILFLILPVLAFPEIVFGEQTLYKTDLTWMHFPRHIFAAEEWLAGRVPLWDPYEDAGIPLLAETQVGVLYPVSILFLSPFSPSLELSLFILIHFSLGASFTFILARSVGLSRAAATVAGLAFGFGGFLMAQVPNLNIMTGAVWLPLILSGVILTLRRRSWLVAMLAGIPLTLQVFTAQPQIVFYTLVTILGYGLYKVCAEFFFGDETCKGQIRYALHSGLLLLTAVFSGLLLAAPQLIPTYELQQLSMRSQERGLDFLTHNSLSPFMWLNLLIPSAFGNNVTGFKGGDPFQEDFIYVGFIPLLLTFFGIASFWGRSKDKYFQDRLFFLLISVGAALLAMGDYTPIYDYVVQYLPGFALFRIPARWLMVVNLGLAMLAGIGMEALLDRRISRHAVYYLLLFGLLLIAGLTVIWFFRTELLWWSSNLSGTVGKLSEAFLNKSFDPNPTYWQDRLLAGWVAGLRTPAILLVANILAAALLFFLFAARRIKATTFAGLTILALSLDLAIAGGTTVNPTKPADWWWQLSGGAQYVLDNLEEERVFPLGMGSEELTVSHLGQYFPSVYAVRSAGGHGSSLRIRRYGTFLQEAHPVQAIQVVGARYLLAEGYIGEDAAATYPIVYADDHSIVHENKNPLPRAFVVHQAVQVETAADALAAFQNRDIDPRQTVIIEADSGIPLPATVEDSSRSLATVTNENPQFLEIETSLTGDGYLVLLDTYYPGWVATVDDQQTPIYRANYIGRAIFVPAGEHVVRFKYEPWSFKLGLWLSLLLLLVIIATIIIRIRRSNPLYYS